MPRCVAIGCNNNGSHRFPRDPQLKELWEIATKIRKFQANPNSRLCSKHFKNSDFLDITTSATGMPHICKHLRKGVVPSIFSWTKPTTYMVLKKEVPGKIKQYVKRTKTHPVKILATEEMASSINKEINIEKIKVEEIKIEKIKVEEKLASERMASSINEKIKIEKIKVEENLASEGMASSINKEINIDEIKTEVKDSVQLTEYLPLPVTHLFPEENLVPERMPLTKNEEIKIEKIKVEEIKTEDEDSSIQVTECMPGVMLEIEISNEVYKVS